MISIIRSKSIGDVLHAVYAIDLFVSGGAIGASWRAATQAMVARGVL